MTTTAILLVLASAVMHAGWNLMAKHGRSEAVFFHRLLLTVAVAGLVPAVLAQWWGGPFPWRVWAYLAVSGIACGGYYAFLALGYRSGDFTAVYPVARALPVLLVALADAALGRAPSPLGWAGCVLVASGCVLAPLERWGPFDRSRYLRLAGLWTLLTALCTVAYSLLDDTAAGLIPWGPTTALQYGYFFFLAAYLVYLPLYRLFLLRGNTTPDPGWRTTLVAAPCNFGAYWLVLWAYALVEQVSYLVAFRQFSILVGVAVALFLLKEPGWRVRLPAALMITAGLVAIALAG